MSLIAYDDHNLDGVCICAFNEELSTVRCQAFLLHENNAQKLLLPRAQLVIHSFVNGRFLLLLIIPLSFLIIHYKQTSALCKSATEREKESLTNILFINIDREVL